MFANFYCIKGIIGYCFCGSKTDIKMDLLKRISYRQTISCFLTTVYRKYECNVPAYLTLLPKIMVQKKGVVFSSVTLSFLSCNLAAILVPATLPW